MPVTSSSWANHVILQAVRVPRYFRCDVAHKQIFVKAKMKVIQVAMTDALWLYLRNLFRGLFFTMGYNSTTSCSTPAMFQALGTMSIMLASFKKVSTYSSQVKSSHAKPRSRVESSRIQSSQVNSSQVKSAPTPIYARPM